MPKRMPNKTALLDASVDPVSLLLCPAGAKALNSISDTMARFGIWKKEIEDAEDRDRMSLTASDLRNFVAPRIDFYNGLAWSRDGTRGHKETFIIYALDDVIMKAGLALAIFSWMPRMALQAFLTVRPGSWCVQVLGQQCDLPADLGPILAVSAGFGHTCAVRADGELICFGWNHAGQCDVPADLGPVLAVSAGNVHACAVRSDGQLVCFGEHINGQWDVAVDFSAGFLHTCAVRTDGQLVCFGDNDQGQCDIPADLGQVVAVSAGGVHTCAVRTDGELICFGNEPFGASAVPEDLGQVCAVSAGGDHTCAVRTDGQLVCFGDNDEGQCDVPADLGRVVAVSAGGFHTCAVRADGELICFGNNSDGQCDVPADLGRVLAVSAGNFHTCAVRLDGQLVCKERTPSGSLVCRQIADELWQSQREAIKSRKKDLSQWEQHMSAKEKCYHYTFALPRHVHFGFVGSIHLPKDLYGITETHQHGADYLCEHAVKIARALVDAWSGTTSGLPSHSPRDGPGILQGLPIGS
ncbi:E3 ISG15--protein ligase Herc6 [Symbiodinium microadriaticum]|uniref:E3 ISG15--protein ligase Herc6 n=1 Tax=Symbiodinium microadriaticum TaxID=2951 RepID=A0A1Q9BYU2_SYMMI|nr:E3 ISG15--protein ligase Herc6 [Symbiodinium microadriaticum]